MTAASGNRSRGNTTRPQAPNPIGRNPRGTSAAPRLLRNWPFPRREGTSSPRSVAYGFHENDLANISRSAPEPSQRVPPDGQRVRASEQNGSMAAACAASSRRRRSIRGACIAAIADGHCYALRTHPERCTLSHRAVRLRRILDTSLMSTGTPTSSSARMRSGRLSGPNLTTPRADGRGRGRSQSLSTRDIASASASLVLAELMLERSSGG